MSRAFVSAAGPNSSEFHHHWYFQTDGGKRFWAEGPYYFHLTLSEIIPFWHTVRINDLRSETGLVGFTIANEPFFASWLTTPLEWLADIVTPDGKTPPLDDGNKQSMNHSSVLRWTSSYGLGVVGQKFAWISGRPANGLGSSRDLLPVELAIPRLDNLAGLSPDDSWVLHEGCPPYR